MAVRFGFVHRLVQTVSFNIRIYAVMRPLQALRLPAVTVLLTTFILTATSRAVPDAPTPIAVPEKQSTTLDEPDQASKKVKAIIGSLRNATSAISRRRAVLDLIKLGPDAIPAILSTLEQTPPKKLHATLQRVVVTLRAEKLKPRIRERVSTGLFFDGQYDDFKSEGADVGASVLSIVEDEGESAAMRQGALNALADIAEAEFLPRIRTLESDPLLDPDIREELGTLMAILGDTRRVDRKIRHFVKDIENPNIRVAIEANSQLAHLYYRIRRYSKAVECYDRILKVYNDIEKAQGFPRSASFFRQKALRHYNAACSCTLAGALDKAKENLLKAVELDPTHLANMEKDGDLKKLRDSEDFPQFKKELKKLLKDRSL